MMNTKKPCLPPSTPYYSSESEFRSGYSSQGIEKGGMFFFPIMHQQQDPNWHRGLDSFCRDKHPVSSPILPLRQTCQGHPLSTTRFRHLPKRNQRPERQTPPFQAWLTFCGQRCHLHRLTAAAKQDVSHSKGATAAQRKGYENSCWEMKY